MRVPDVAGTLLTWDQYATRWAGLHGGVDPRFGGLSMRGWLRLAYRGARVLARVRMRPGTVTALGLALCLPVPFLAAARGWWPLVGAGFVLLSAVADSLDGALAVVTGRVTRLGYVYDSVADRLAEAAWLLAFVLLGARVWLVVLVGGLSFLHEYTRARATAAGMTEIGTITLAERPTRVIITVVALALAGIGGPLDRDLAAGTITAAAAIWVILAVVGLLQLIAAMHVAFRHRSPSL